MHDEDFRSQWFAKHNPIKMFNEILTQFFQEFKDHTSKCITLHCIGFCFGAFFVMEFLNGNYTIEGIEFESGVITHPTFLYKANDMSIWENLKKPLLIQIGDGDIVVTLDSLLKFIKVMQIHKKVYQLTLLGGGLEHGFACRGDLAEDCVKYGFEKCISDQIDWFKKY